MNIPIFREGYEKGVADVQKKIRIEREKINLAQQKIQIVEEQIQAIEEKNRVAEEKTEIVEKIIRDLVLYILESGNKNIEEIAKILGHSVKYVQRIIDEK